MKQAFILAAGALLGLAEAGVHKMKLQKIPLSEQLVRWHLWICFLTLRSTDLVFHSGAQRSREPCTSPRSEVYGHSPSDPRRRDVQRYLDPRGRFASSPSQQFLERAM